MLKYVDHSNFILFKYFKSSNEDKVKTRKKLKKSSKTNLDASQSNLQPTMVNEATPSVQLDGKKKKKRDKLSKNSAKEDEEDNESIIRQILEATLTPKSKTNPNAKLSESAKRPKASKKNAETVGSDGSVGLVEPEIKEGTKKRSKTKTKANANSNTIAEKEVFQVVQSKALPKSKSKITD